VIDETNDGWLVPVPLELEALEKAKKHLKQYSLRQVSAWLTTVTGREISHVGLMKRIKSEQSQRRKSSTYRELADRYEKALKKAQEYEKRTGTGQDSFFGSDRFVELSATFSDNSTDS
jgi:type IV secretory pathway VirB4 component